MNAKETTKTLDEYLWVFTETERNLLSRAASVLCRAGYANVALREKYLYATGRTPIMLVAHADTVHGTPPEADMVFCDPKRGVVWSPDGLGADDRAGVMGIMELVRRGHRPHVLITTGEESGCVGAREFVSEVKDTGVVYVIELDRKNSGEAVFYDCCNTSFTKYVCSFGFEEADGILTDITTICPAWGVAGVNLSCGYHNAHTTAEYLVLPAMWETLEKVEKMLQNPPRKRFKYERAARPSLRIPLRGDFGRIETGRDLWCYRGTYSRYSYLGDDRGSRRYCGNFSVVVDVDVETLMSIYGGTEEEWERLLEDAYYDLWAAAEGAVYEEIETLVHHMPDPTRMARS